MTAGAAGEVGPARPQRVALAWIDPPGDPARASAAQLVDDLDLVVRPAGGNERFGNESLHPGAPDRSSNAELVDVASPAAGRWEI